MELKKDREILALRLQLIETTGRLLQAEHALISQQLAAIDAQIRLTEGEGNGSSMDAGQGNPPGTEGGAPGVA